MSSKVTLAIVAIIIILVGAFMFMQMQSPANTMSPTENQPTAGTPEVTPSTATTTGTSETPTTSGTSYTMAQVAEHKDKTSCWSAIDGNVYDLTTWIGRHPGGQAAITQLCGKDGTTTFHGQHGENKQQADVLAGFKLGTVTK